MTINKIIEMEKKEDNNYIIKKPSFFGKNKKKIIYPTLGVLLTSLIATTNLKSEELKEPEKPGRGSHYAIGMGIGFVVGNGIYFIFVKPKKDKAKENKQKKDGFWYNYFTYAIGCTALGALGGEGYYQGVSLPQYNKDLDA